MLKIGIVGAGIIAGQHKNTVLKHGGCELSAVCDIDISRAAALAEGTGAEIYSDYRLMAEQAKLDAVIINLPHFLHCAAAECFLENKMHVLMEKPMAMTSAECEIMKCAAKRNGKKLAVGHLQRYVPAHKELKKIIDEKILGDLCLVTETRNIDYFTNRPEWFLDKNKSGGGIAMNYGAHTMDKLFWLTGAKVTEVKANVFNNINSANIEAFVQAIVSFDNSVSASVSYCASRVNYLYETYFFFSNGIAKIDNGMYLSVSPKDKPFENVLLDYDANAIEEQFAEFVKYISDGGGNIADADYGRKVISVIEKIYGADNTYITG